MKRMSAKQSIAVVVVAILAVVAAFGFWLRLEATKSMGDLLGEDRAPGLEITAIPGAVPRVEPGTDVPHEDDDGGGLGGPVEHLDAATADLVTLRAVAAAEAWVTQSSEESVAERAVRLAPFFGEGSAVPEGRLPQRGSGGASLEASVAAVGSAAFYNPGGEEVGVNVVLSVVTVSRLEGEQWVDTSTATLLVRLASIDGEWWPMGVSAQ